MEQIWSAEVLNITYLDFKNRGRNACIAFLSEHKEIWGYSTDHKTRGNNVLESIYIRYRKGLEMYLVECLPHTHEALGKIPSPI